MTPRLHRSAEKYLSKLPLNQAERILKAIYKLPLGDVEVLKGRKSEKRLRVGNFRVIFEEIEGQIYVTEIGARGDVYK
jgi:mRNA interferase RelE/StbE